MGNALQVKVGGAQSGERRGQRPGPRQGRLRARRSAGRGIYSVGGNQITISNGVRQKITGAFTRDVGSVQANVSLASIDDNMMATYDEKAGAVIVQLVKGAVAESVSGDKNLTSTAAELHIAGAISTSAAGVKQLVGGVHLRKVAGDIVVSGVEDHRRRRRRQVQRRRELDRPQRRSGHHHRIEDRPRGRGHGEAGLQPEDRLTEASWRTR